MPKSQYSDPKFLLGKGKISFNDIDVNVYNKTIAQEKKNFSKDDLFIMKRPPEYSYDTYKTDLYVPVRLCKILSSGTGVKMDSKDEVCYNDWVEIEFDPCFTVKFNRCKVEKFPIDYEPQEPYEWSSNYGSVARPCYYHYKNIKTGERAGIIKRWCEIEQHHGYVMKVWEAGPYKKITYSPERQRLMKMSNEIKEKLNMNLTYYDLERLTSLYNITEKEV